MAAASDTHRAIDAVWRIESAKIIAALARMVRDVGLAEELAQDALVAALEQWPKEGVPRNPGAWLMAAAKHRAIDRLRRHSLFQRKHEQLAYELDAAQAVMPDFEAALDDDVGDDLLRLIFTACHPVLSTEARVALTLREVCGLTTEEIARAFLTSAPTLAQRIVRAKAKIRDASIPYTIVRSTQFLEFLGGIAHSGAEGDAVRLSAALIQPIAMDEGLRFAIREGGRTVASGRVTKITK